jgi:hypothetical protein
MRIEDDHVRLALLKEPGCPACRAAGDAERRTMRWFLRENYAEAPTQRALLGKRECTRHARPLMAGDNAHLSRTFEFLAQAMLSQVDEPRVRRLISGGRPGEAAERQCLVCEAGERAAVLAIAKVVRLLDSQPGRTAYFEHDGLCLPHHERAVGQAEPELAGWLQKQLRPRMEALLEVFAMHFRRLDVRFQGEPEGEEGTALS